MVCKLEQPLRIPLSRCDDTATLNLSGVVAMCMDIAADHASELKIGSEMNAKQNKFWLAVRTKISFTRRPALGEPAVLITWPQPPGRARCIRQYAIADAEGTRVMCGKTEWAMIDVSTGRLCDLTEVYPKDTVYCEDPGCVEEFGRISETFTEQQLFASYTVTSADIDLGRHMNNAAYVRALLGLFSCEQLRAMAFTQAEFVYRKPCFEGETLQVYLREIDDGIEVAFFKPDGKAAMLARLTK